MGMEHRWPDQRIRRARAIPHGPVANGAHRRCADHGQWCVPYLRSLPSVARGSLGWAVSPGARAGNRGIFWSRLRAQAVFRRASDIPRHAAASRCRRSGQL